LLADPKHLKLHPGVSMRFPAIRQWFDERIAANFGPRHAARFALRIALRSLKLRWREHWRALSLLSVLRVLPRPVFVVAIAATTVWLLSVAGIEPTMVGEKIRRLVAGDADRFEWQSALLLIGAPIAFVLWVFRDHNVNATLANQRKDVNLKEFQEIQVRAAGGLDKNLPESARETLQIAALHQLRGFLRGSFGPDFRRPAFELLRARMRQRCEQPDFALLVSDCRTAIAELASVDDESCRSIAESLRAELREHVDTLFNDPASRADRAILIEDGATLFRSTLPIVNTDFGCVSLPDGAVICGVNLEKCSFIGSELNCVHAEGAHFNSADLRLVSFIGANLQRARLVDAKLGFANLGMAHADRANFTVAELSGAYCGAS
jgi:hypothetical protein